MDTFRFHSAGDVTVKAGHRIPERKLSDYELVYFPIGTQTVYRTDGSGEELNDPCIIVTRPGEPHSYQFDPMKPTRHLFIHFDCDPETVRSRYSLLTATDSTVIALQDHSLVPQLLNQLLFYFHRRPERWRPLTESLMLAMLEELESMVLPGSKPAVEATMPMQIDQALQYIDLHVTEKIEVEQLARSAGWSHEHFTRTFQQYIGFSPKMWITKRRLDLAAQLLLRNAYSIKEAARNAGFSDEYYFHRLFRQKMGITATEYRRKYGDSRMSDLAPLNDLGRFYPRNHLFVMDSRQKK